MSTVIFKDKKSFTVILHLMAWGLLCAVPYLFNTGNDLHFWLILKRSWLPLGFSALIFYINYFLLADRFYFSKKTLEFIGINLVLVLLAYNGNIFIKSLFPSTANAEATDALSLNRMERIRELVRFSSVLSFLLAIILSILLKMNGKWISAEAEKEKSEKMRLEAELSHLRYQLQPHFFFNSLNNIYALVDRSPGLAKNAIHGLAKLMRYLLYETNNEKMSLSAEIDFLIRYIQLMELRLTSNITVEYDFPEVDHSIQIAPLLFIPLIENAFKHGIPLSGNGTIFFKMTIDSGKLAFTSGNPNIPKDNRDQSGSGIGIENLKKRLQLIYPEQYTFSSLVDKELYITTLVLNFE